MLVEEVGFSGRPAWSPDGKCIAYRNRDQQIAAVPAVGGSPEIILAGAQSYLHPSWSPDGSLMALVVLEENSSGASIWTKSLSGGELEPLTLGGAGSDWAPSWSPDGESLAFMSERSNSQDIWTIPALGGRPVQLTTYSGPDLWPFWLPGGSQIAFASNRNWGGEWLWDLWAVPAAGGTPHRIFSGNSGKLWHPSISPDGTLVAYASEGTGGDLYVSPLKGGTPRLLATSGYRPSFSPDGTRIAYYQNDSIGVSIFIADVSRIVNPGFEIEL